MDNVIQVVSGWIFNADRSQVLIVNNIGSIWSPPGGGVEKGELLESAIVREAWEEVGLHVRPERLVSIAEGFNERKGHKLVFFGFLLNQIDPMQQPSIQMPDEIAEIRWVNRAELMQMLPWLPFDPWQIVEDMTPRIYRTEII